MHTSYPVPPPFERVGLAYIQSRLLPDAEARAELARRFFFSQQFSQDDPWAARVKGAEHEQHAPMARFQPVTARQEELA